MGIAIGGDNTRIGIDPIRTFHKLIGIAIGISCRVVADDGVYNCKLRTAVSRSILIFISTTHINSRSLGSRAVGNHRIADDVARHVDALVVGRHGIVHHNAGTIGQQLVCFSAIGDGEVFLHDVGIARIEVETIDDDIVLIGNGNNVHRMVLIAAEDNVGRKAGSIVVRTLFGDVRTIKLFGESAIESHVGARSDGSCSRMSTDVSSLASHRERSLLHKNLHMRIAHAVEQIVCFAFRPAFHQCILEEGDGIGKVSAGMGP